MVKINLWSGWQEASATGCVEMQEMQEGRVVLLVKAENSQPTSSTVTWPHWSGRTAWNRNANLLCWLRPSTLGPHFYVMEKGNLCPGSQITNETCLIIEKCFSSETKPFGASYTSHFLSLQGLPALQFAALLSNQDTEDISEGSCAPAADLQSQLAAPKEQYKAAHLLQDGIDLALLLLALESSPITCVWHQRNLFMPLVSLTGQRCQGNEKFGDFPIFRPVTGQTESKPWGTGQQGHSSQSTDFDLRGTEITNLYLLSATLPLWQHNKAQMLTVTNESKSTDVPEIHYLSSKASQWQADRASRLWDELVKLNNPLLQISTQKFPFKHLPYFLVS